MKEFKVGIFEYPGKTKLLFRAYTQWYNNQWSGCCEHIVNAENGAEAKKSAIKDHKEKCLKGEVKNV